MAGGWFPFSGSSALTSMGLLTADCSQEDVKPTTLPRATPRVLPYPYTAKGSRCNAVLQKDIRPHGALLSEVQDSRKL